MDVLRVSATSPARALAGCIAGVIREQGRAEMQAIGAAAVNQATKAAAIARGFLELEGIDVVVVPSFTKRYWPGRRITLNNRRRAYSMRRDIWDDPYLESEQPEPTFRGFLLAAVGVAVGAMFFAALLASCGMNWALLD